jgi:glutamate racemase
MDPGKRVLGVIRPTTEVIGDYTESNHIGILGTQGTVDSGSYLIEIGKSFPDVHVYQQACPAWVPLVESGEYLDNEIADPILLDCLTKLGEQSPKIDTILLACTHYPLLYPRIRYMLPNHMQVVSQGEIVAESLVSYLQRHPEMGQKISKGQEITFSTTGNAEEFRQAASAFWGEDVVAQQVKL